MEIVPGPDTSRKEQLKLKKKGVPMQIMKTIRNLALITAALACALVLLPTFPGLNAAHGEVIVGNAVAYPADADGLVPLLDAPRADAGTIAQLPGGVLVWLDGETEPVDGYYKVVLHLKDAEAGTEGYIAQDELQKTDDLQKLFEIAAVTPLPGRREMTFSYAASYWPGMEEYTQAMDQGEYWPAWEMEQKAGQMLYASKDRDGGGISMLPGNCTVWAKMIPKDKRFGIVVAPEFSRRQILWQEPQEAGTELGQYYSGMQAEILGEEGSFWKVRLGEKEGYLAKEALREVLAWEGKPE